MKRVLVVLVCLALVFLAGTGWAHKKGETGQPAPPQAQAPQSQPADPAKAPQPPVAGVQPVALGVVVSEMDVIIKG